MKRIEYIDIAKAIAIFCVIAGHSFPEGNLIHEFVYSFHMPLFFILSGYFFNPFKLLDIKKQMHSLIAPYVLTCCILVFVGTVIAVIVDGPIKFTFIHWTVASLFGSAGTPLSIGPIWFLPALFFGRIFLYTCCKTGHPAVFAVLLFCVGHFSIYIGQFPFGVQQAMCATPFLVIGMAARTYHLFNHGVVPVAPRMIMFALWITACCFGGQLDIALNIYDHIALNIAGAICGSFCVVWFACFLSDNLPRKISSALQYIGMSTLAILCVHTIECDLIPMDQILSAGVPLSTWLVARTIVVFLFVYLISKISLTVHSLSGSQAQTQKAS